MDSHNTIMEAGKILDEVEQAELRADHIS